MIHGNGGPCFLVFDARRWIFQSMTVTLILVTCQQSPADILWDNGPTDGQVSMSNVQRSVFGAERAVLDDFVVPTMETWTLTGFRWTHVWNSLPAGSGTGINLQIWSDNFGEPGGPIASAVVNSYSESATGNVFFGRPEAESSVEFDPIVLSPGSYWYRAFIIGPENNFWMARRSSFNGSEAWVDYEDFGGLMSTTAVFGAGRESNFVLSGTSSAIPEPSMAWVFIGLTLAIAMQSRSVVRRQDG